MHSTTKQRLTAILIGFLSAFIVLEGSLQAVHLINKISTKPQTPASFSGSAKPFTVMCIGESMTAGINGAHYPDKLQTILTKQYPDKNIVVLNKGVYKSTAYVYLRDMEYYLNTCKPDVVVAMLGINDIKSFITDQHIKTRITPSFWNHLRSVYLLKSLFLSLKEKKLAAKNTLSNNFTEQINYYRQQETFSYFLLNDFAMLDRSMLKHANTPISHTFWSAKTQLNSGNAHQCLRLLQKAATLSPKTADIYALAGVTLSLNSSPQCLQSAAKLIKTVDNKIQFDPKSANSLTAALKKLCKRFSPSEADFYMTWGRWHHQYSVFNEAKSAYQKGAAEAQQTTPDFNALLASINRSTGNTSKAVKQINEILKTNPSNLLALREAAFIEFNFPPTATQTSAKHLLECIKHYPQFKSAYIALAINAYQQQNYQTTRNMLEQAAQIEPLTNVREVQMLEDTYVKLDQTEPTKRGNRIFSKHYREIFEIIDKNNTTLVAMQYPMRNVESLRAVFTPAQRKKIFFADNTPAFTKALQTKTYNDLFLDNFARNFGHLTQLGCQLTAQTAAKAIGRIINTKL